MRQMRELGAIGDLGEADKDNAGLWGKATLGAAELIGVPDNA